MDRGERDQNLQHVRALRAFLHPTVPARHEVSLGMTVGEIEERIRLLETELAHLRATLRNRTGG